MPREKEFAREIIAEIAVMFPGKHALNYSEVAEYVGCDPRTAKKKFPFVDGIIAVVKLANILG